MKTVKKGLNSLLSELTIKLEKKLKENLISIVLFGSVARGEFRRDSDIDLLIICKDLPYSISERIELFTQIEDSLVSLKRLEKRGYFLSLSPLLRTEKEANRISPLYLDMVTDAKILFDRNNFFHSIISRLKLKLKKYGSKKVKIGKLWYWDLKPDYKFGEVIEIE